MQHWEYLFRIPKSTDDRVHGCVEPLSGLEIINKTGKNLWVVVLEEEDGE